MQSKLDTKVEYLGGHAQGDIVTSNPHKRNLTFSWLEAILILMVVDCHAGSAVGLLRGFFPYDSFFMPAFVFISGYFFRCSQLSAFVKKKIKRQLIPYLAWCCVGLLTSAVLDASLGFHWLTDLPSGTVVRKVAMVLTIGPPTSANGASWFLIMLFWVEITYAIIQQYILRGGKPLNYVALIVSFVIAVVSVRLCILGYWHNLKTRFLLRELFFLFFFHTGHMFRIYWVSALRKLPRFRVCVACLAANTVMIGFFGGRVSFIRTQVMDGFSVSFLPFLTSLTGIAFWYEIAEYLAELIGEKRGVSCLAANTGTVMQAHLFGESLPFIIAYGLHSIGLVGVQADDLAKIARNAWNHPSSVMQPIATFAFGLLFSFVAIVVLDKCKSWLERVERVSW